MRKKLSGLVLFASVALIAPLQAIAQQAPPQPSPQSPPQWYWGPGPWHMWGDGYGWHFWWMPFLMMLFMFLVCAAVIYFLFSRGGMHHGGPVGHMTDRMWSPPTHSALQILNERFARGEIQKDEYEDKKATILSGVQR
jgi:putative membrane protein